MNLSRLKYLNLSQLMSELQSKISANRIKLSTLGFALGVFAIASSSGIALLTKFEQVQKENHALVMNELAMRTGAVIHHELRKPYLAQ